jgi:hypothetical protein
LSIDHNEPTRTDPSTMTMMMQDDVVNHADTMMMNDDGDDAAAAAAASEERLGLSSRATTIDPSVVQSRIRQSASLQAEAAAADAMEDGDQQQPVFPKLSASQASGNKSEYRRVRCPPHRYTPLREHWEQILTPLVEYLKLQVCRLVCIRNKATLWGGHQVNKR